MIQVSQREPFERSGIGEESNRGTNVGGDYLIDKIYGLVLAVGGYFGRVFQERISKGRMRKQLYQEISNNYYAAHIRIATATSLSGLAQGAPLRFTDKLDISFHVYEHNKVKGSVFDLREGEAISRIYDKFHRIKEEHPGYPHVRAKEALAEVDERLLDGSLDAKLYRKASSPNAWRFMDDLLSGRRASWTKSLNPI